MTKKQKPIHEIEWKHIDIHHIERKIESERRRMNETFDFMLAAAKNMHYKSNGHEHDRVLIDGFIREWDLHRYQSRSAPLSNLLSALDSPLWKSKLMELNGQVHGSTLTLPKFQGRVREYLRNLAPSLKKPEVGQEQLGGEL